MKIYTDLREIKNWNTKYLSRSESNTDALRVNLLDNSETTQTEKIHRPNSTRQNGLKPQYKH
jgi:hypothetical protein